MFEVKLKRSADETDKNTPDELEATLTTAFDRVTLAARERSERLTCDLGVRLVGPNGSSVRMRRDLILVETKSA